MVRSAGACGRHVDAPQVLADPAPLTLDPLGVYILLGEKSLDCLDKEGPIRASTVQGVTGGLSNLLRPQETRNLDCCDIPEEGLFPKFL